MTDFGELVEGIQHKANGDGHDRLTREEQLEILAAMSKPAPQISWTQKDLNETCEHIFKHVDDRFKTLLPAIGKFVESRVQFQRQHIVELERRIDEMEHRTEHFRYVGVWESGEQYRLGNFVTHDGSVWHCNAETQSKPGTDAAAWTLTVKHGNDFR
jgi:hypothetical protein